MRETIQNANGKQFHAVSLSGGKDSTAMLLLMIERDMPINTLPCLPATRAWHAPVTVPKEESSSDSSAALHGGQDTPALPAPAVLR